MMDSAIADVAWSKISFFLQYRQNKENGAKVTVKKRTCDTGATEVEDVRRRFHKFQYLATSNFMCTRYHQKSCTYFRDKKKLHFK
jgi:hypothetical protein